jgi:DNA modification methylase
VFPVGLPAFVMEAYSDAGGAVYEPFAGSGTTLLAAQQTGRRAYALEIAPAYVDVAVKRFRQNHPEIPVTLAATGQTFDEVAEERLDAADEAAA